MFIILFSNLILSTMYCTYLKSTIYSPSYHNSNFKMRNLRLR